MSELVLKRLVPDLDSDKAFEWHAINYTHGLEQRLHKDVLSNIFRGEVREISFYIQDDELALDPSTGAVIAGTKVVREDHVYTRDANGLAIRRDITINWIQEDGSDHPSSKVRTKIYSPLEQGREGTRRRTNVVDQMKLQLVGMLAATETAGDFDAAVLLGQQFFTSHFQEIAEFVETASDQIVSDLVADTSPWMDNLIAPGVTIRLVLLDQVQPIV